MLTLTQLPNTNISIKADYYYKDRIKRISGSSFDFDTKEWVIPLSSFAMLEKEFQGELVFATPRWIILKQPMPDMEKMYRLHNQNIQVPDLKLSPYDYQSYGIRFMIDRILKHGFVLNADDVGLGKTIMAIATIKWFIKNRGMKKLIIICKKSIKGQWIDEIRKFTDLDQEFAMIKTEDTAKKRQKAYAEFNKCEKGILVTNYHSFLNDTSYFLQMGIEFVVIDEVHSIKAKDGILNNNIGKLTRGKPTVFLTGTPIMSKPTDIYGIIQMVNPWYFGEWKQFEKLYLTIDYGGRYGARVVGAKNLDKLRSKVQDIVIRRTEFEVPIKLPQVIIKQMDCSMDATQEKILKKIQMMSRDYDYELSDLKAKPKPNAKDLEQMVKIETRSKGLIAARQAAVTDPRMFALSRSKIMKQEFAVLVPKNYAMSSKIEAVLELVEDILKSGNKVILFSKFKTSADMVAADIEKAMKVPVLLYTGGVNEAERDDAARKFRETTAYNILVGTEAMAEGLNLQCSKYVINIDQPDSFAIKVQRLGRVRRVGSQFGSVIIYDMITKSLPGIKSKDEERLENIQNNKNMTDALVSIDEAQRKALINAMSK